MSFSPKSLAIVAVLGVLAILSGCGGGSTSTMGVPQPDANLRFVQANASAGTVDVLLDSSVLRSGIAYNSDTGYIPVVSGMRQLATRPSGTNGSAVNIATGSKNTFILGGWGTLGTMTLSLADDTTPPAAGNFKLRIAHVASQASSIDFFVMPSPSAPSGSPSFHPISVPSASSYLSLPAGTYDIFVTTAGTTTVLFDSGPITFTAGQNRTVVVFSDCQPTSCGVNTFKTMTLADLN